MEIGRKENSLVLEPCDALEAAGGTAPKAASRRRKRTKAV